MRPYDLTEGPQEEVTRGISNHKKTLKDLTIGLGSTKATKRQVDSKGPSHLARSRAAPKANLVFS